MAAKDFEVQEDVWIGNVEQKPINPEGAEGGAFRLKKGEKITSERARALGLLGAGERQVVTPNVELVRDESEGDGETKAKTPAEDKAVKTAENKAVAKTAKK